MNSSVREQSAGGAGERKRKRERESALKHLQEKSRRLHGRRAERSSFTGILSRKVPSCLTFGTNIRWTNREIEVQSAEVSSRT